MSNIKRMIDTEYEQQQERDIDLMAQFRELETQELEWLHRQRELEEAGEMELIVSTYQTEFEDEIVA